MRISPVLFCIALNLFSWQAGANSLPKVTGLELNGDLLSWDAQVGATGYNIHLDEYYFDTVRGELQYTVSEPGKYHVISFNDEGEFGVTREPGEDDENYTHVEFTGITSIDDNHSNPSGDPGNAPEGTPTKLPMVTGLELTANELSWDKQEGASGYNIIKDLDYFDTVRESTTYTVTEPGRYQIISFNDNGVFGDSYKPTEDGYSQSYVEYDGCVEHGTTAASCQPGLSLTDPEFFKEVALGAEYGSAIGVIKKWRSSLRYHVVGEIPSALSREIDKVVSELNALVNIEIQEAENESEANFIMMFGSGEDYVRDYEPNTLDLVEANYGLVWIYWNSVYEITHGSMFVDMVRTDSIKQQKHLIREELTQSIGLLSDSMTYPDSIFYSYYSQPTEFTPIDREVIRALYSPDIAPGMKAAQIDELLK